MLADFARCLVAQLENRDTVGLKPAFEAIERLHIDGDSYVREAATIGILESLQNSNLHRNTRPLDFEPYLHAESRRWWGKLNSFWDGDATALRDNDGAT